MRSISGKNISLDAAVRDVEQRYVAANPRSREQFERACQSMPGGNTRSVLFYDPFPVTLAGGSGARVTDLDGNVYTDFLGEFTAGLYGHSNPKIIAAVSAALKGGIVLGGRRGVRFNEACEYRWIGPTRAIASLSTRPPPARNSPTTEASTWRASGGRVWLGCLGLSAWEAWGCRGGAIGQLAQDGRRPVAALSTHRQELPLPTDRPPLPRIALGDSRVPGQRLSRASSIVANGAFQTPLAQDTADDPRRCVWLVSEQ